MGSACWLMQCGLWALWARAIVVYACQLEESKSVDRISTLTDAKGAASCKAESISLLEASYGSSLDLLLVAPSTCGKLGWLYQTACGSQILSFLLSTALCGDFARVCPISLEMGRHLVESF
ncbi:hypothetical protein HAX54_023047 [Datura stramonium]|uniref:Secreted protein n=1 Tax=Datura stramonium TaxID=4076 RepID=A0ABS8UVT9_DATST|nr:hypothetical protein [Datura stramonium]